MRECNTGNLVVDEVSNLDIQGYTIPRNWYYTITNENGKPHYLAIAILATIVNAYQAREVRDEITGEVVDYVTKFEDDMYAFYYGEYEEQFGESHSTIKRAIVLLEKLRIVKRVLNTIMIKDVRRISNVVFIKLNVDALKEVTFLENLPSRTIAKKCKRKDVTNDCNIESNNDVRLQQAMVNNEQVVLAKVNSPMQQVAIQKLDETEEVVTEHELRSLEAWLAIHLDELFVDDLDNRACEDDSWETGVYDESYNIEEDMQIQQEDNIANAIQMVQNQNQRRLEISMSVRLC